MRRTILSTLLLTLGLAACGGSVDPKEAGYDAFADGDYQAAAGHFESALEGLATDDPAYRDLKIDLARSKALVDPDGAKDVVTALGGEVELEAKHYSKITADLVSAKALAPAVEVVHLGLEAFPDDQKLAQVLERVKEASDAAGDTDATDALSGHGYIGNSE